MKAEETLFAFQNSNDGVHVIWIRSSDSKNEVLVIRLRHIFHKIGGFRYPDNHISYLISRWIDCVLTSSQGGKK